jgi:hypothetical protein
MPAGRLSRACARYAVSSAATTDPAGRLAIHGVPPLPLAPTPARLGGLALDDSSKAGENLGKAIRPEPHVRRRSRDHLAREGLDVDGLAREVGRLLHVQPLEVGLLEPLESPSLAGQDRGRRSPLLLKARDPLEYLRPR